MTRVLKKDNIYLIVRIIIGLLFALNVVGIFIISDDSQQSRLAFNAFQSLLLLLASTIPGVIERKTKLDIPDFMEIVFIIVCICHFVLGEMASYYVRYSWWDSMLHTLTGVSIAIIGFAIVNTINQDKLKLPPFFVAFFAVCFAVTIAVLWEISEFLADYMTGSNMQRYRNDDTLQLYTGRRALFDTMKDLILDLMGAIFISIIGYLQLRYKKEAFKRIRFEKLKEKEEELSKVS